MSLHHVNRCDHLRDNEEGVSAVEYAVMIGILIAGCILAFVMGGPSTNGSKRPSTVAIKIRDDDRTVRAAPIARDESPPTTGASARTAADSRNNSAGSGRSRSGSGSESGTSLTYQKVDSKSASRNDSPHGKPKSDPGAASPPTAGASQAAHANAESTRPENGMTAEDARQALAALVHAHPGSFATSQDRIWSASAVEKAGSVEIDQFRCNLRAKTFACSASSSGAGRSSSTISGAFYQDANQQWVATITRNAR